MVHLFIIFTGIMPIRHQPSIPGNFKLHCGVTSGALSFFYQPHRIEEPLLRPVSRKTLRYCTK